MKKFSYKIDFKDRPERLDSYIASKSDLTRSQITRLIKLGHITLNGKVEKSGCRVKNGDKIELVLPDKQHDTLVPEDIPLDIVLEDDDIVVINKPPLMVIYPAAGNRSGTLMNALISKCDKLSSIGAPLRPGVVHRLDKETSGLVVIAKNDNAYYSLVDQFKEREIEKQYLALVHGTLREKNGEISKSIGRSTSDRKKMSTKTKRGKEAITNFIVIEKFKDASLVKIKILTGRTHQIRVHFASIGHPVLGDKTYGKKTSLRLGQKVVKFNRQMLHAFSLKLNHPLNGKSLEFKAELPDDMKEAVDILKRG